MPAREAFKTGSEIAREMGYEIPDRNQSSGQVSLIENRIMLNELPEDLPADPVTVIKGPPRMGKTHWAAKQLVKAGSGNYFSHRHSIVGHAIEASARRWAEMRYGWRVRISPGMCRQRETQIAPTASFAPWTSIVT